jgi:uncharacterized membrane protein
MRAVSLRGGPFFVLGSVCLGGRVLSVLRHRLGGMSVIAIVLVVLGALFVLFFVGGLVVARRRANRPDFMEHVRAADRALERARATDKGWDRAKLEEAALAALRADRPGSQWDAVHLVLVDDKPGVADDVAQLVATCADGQARVELARREGGDWYVEHVE